MNIRPAAMKMAIATENGKKSVGSIWAELSS
jgi:hypothetical protein